jgi:hypothetical protein
VGLDDYLAAGRTTQDLLAQARPDLLPLQEETSDLAPYQETPTGLVWMKRTSYGEVATSLTNFSARIVGDLGRDDGAEVHRMFEIEAKLGGRVERAHVSTQQFSTMNWPIEVLGAGAVVAAGFGLKDRAREAIQRLSGDVPQRRIYTHTGWRSIAGQWVYLHGGGPIGPIGPIPGVEVDLGAGLRRAILPAPPAGDALREAVQKSLSVLDVASQRLTAPLYAAIARAILGGADFSEHLAGATGVGKSELAALVQQHFGAGMDARNLPGSWSSTGNANEELAFQAKDMVLVIDDFTPTGSIADVGRAHRDADRVLRAQGNHSARQRMRADGTLRPPRPPRGLSIGTGEEVPRGQSLRARMLVLEVEAGDLDWNKLTECQNQAARGVFAEATAGFIQWVASKYNQVHEEFRSEVARLRQTVVGGHRRTPTIIADLGAAFQVWLTYARDIGAITSEEFDGLWGRVWSALVEAGEAQVDHQQTEEPVTQFLARINAAITSGRAHVAAPDGSAPESAEGWGWRPVTIGNEGQRDWRSSGYRIGWLDREHLYLEPHAAHVAAQEIARNAGAAALPNPKTLHKRLHERGMLASTDPGRGKLTVRRTLEGRRHDVLHLLWERLVEPESAQSAQSDRSPDETGESAGPIVMESDQNRPSKSAQGVQEELFGSGGTTLTKVPW